MGATVWRGLIVVAALVQLVFLRAVVIDEIERKVALLRYYRREFYLDNWGPAGRNGTLDEFYAEYERRGRVLERWTWILNAIDPPWLRK